MKKIYIGFVFVFVILEVLDVLVHGVILGPAYASIQNLWRPDMMEKMWILHVVKIIVSFLFVFIFSKGYEGKGIWEGVRYGFYIGLMLSIGYAYGSYASFPLPFNIAVQWFIYGIIEYIIAGAVLTFVFSNKSRSTGS